MTAIIQFLLEASVSLCLLYGLYACFFAKTTQFYWNRIFLMAIPILSCLIPLLSLPSLWHSSNSSLSSVQMVVNLEEVVFFQHEVTSSLPKLDIILLLMILYSGGVAFGLARFLSSLFHLYGMIRKIEAHHIGGSKVFIHPHFKASSFLNFIFMPSYSTNHRPSGLILAHEQSHVKKLHSLDLLFIEFFGVFFWFHPLLSQLKDSVKETHEFQVDREMLQKSDIREYGHLLIEPDNIPTGAAYIHYFNQLQTKKRIIMMTKSPSPVWTRFRYALVLPCIALLVFIFSCEKEEDLTLTKSEEVLALSSSPSKVEVFDVVEEMPTPVGGMEGWNQYLKENLAFPSSAKEEGIEGTVYAEFIVDESGKIRDVSLLRGIDGRLDAEALNVLKNSPDWIPGKQDGKVVNVKLRIPIRFKSYPS